jgi:hypothetical protein
MSIIILILIAVVASLAFSGRLSTLVDFVQVKVGLKSETKEMVTYYQWTTSQGEMKVSRTPPPHNNYITFDASEDLQKTDYDIDPEVIAKGQRSREQLTTYMDNGQVSNSHSKESSAARDKAIRSSKANSKCEKINADIYFASQKMSDDSLDARDFDYYQKQLRDAKWEKVKYKC